MSVLRKIFYKIPFLPWLYHFAWALAGAVVYRFPSRRIFVIGVTGTKGKTTVVELLDFILEKAGYKTAALSSVREKIGDQSADNLTGNTMPGRFFIQRFLRKAADSGCQFALIEVTSEGAKMNRHRFIDWNAAVFLNLHPEHIEAHGGFEKYRNAKLGFFKYVAASRHPERSEGSHGRHVNEIPLRQLADRNDVGGRWFFVNKDDEHAKYFTEAADREAFGVPDDGIASVASLPRNDGASLSLRASAKRSREDSQVILFGKSDLPGNLVGEFNKYNVGAAVAVAREVGIGEDDIRQAVAEFSGVPGRMEFVQKEPFAVVVDYAHTPDSLRKVYETLTSVIASEEPVIASEESVIASRSEAISVSDDEIASPRGARNDGGGVRLICVLGAAGGGRDKWKRPEMGKIAAEYCDEIILTNEDPYNEQPEKIIEEIAAGVLRPRNDGALAPLSRNDGGARKIIDRKEAIEKAINLAKPGDAVVITGKGSERFIRVAGGKKIPWSDKQVILDILRETI